MNRIMDPACCCAAKRRNKFESGRYFVRSRFGRADKPSGFRDLQPPLA